MKLINKYQQGSITCYGITLFRGFKRNIEVWFCPSNFEIIKHSHPDEEIELMYIFGKTTFHREADLGKGGFWYENFTPKWYHMFRSFTVRAGVVHWFTVSNWPLIFINFSCFIKGNPRSASVDFKKV